MHTIDLVATYSPSGNTATQSFTITVTSCLISSTPTYPDKSYEIYQGSMQFVVAAYTKSAASCPSITYSAVKQGAASLPTGVTFDPSTRTFTVLSTDDNDAGAHIIEVTGIFTGGSLSNTDDFKKVTFTLTMLACRVTAVSQVDQSVEVFASALTFSAVLFTKMHSNCPDP